MINTKDGTAEGVTVYGYFTATENIKTAFDSAVGSPALKPVIFTITLRNFNGYNGFRLNTCDYSAFPQENEHILQDGIKLFVLKVEDTMIENEHNGFEDYNK